MARRGKSFRSYQPQVVLAMRDIGNSMLTAVCMQITNDCKMEARGGFKGGAFVTRGWQGIRWQILETATGVVGRVGHHEKHFMWWELGHHNAWTRQYERNQWLTRGFARNPLAQQKAANVGARIAAARHSMPVDPRTRAP